MSFNVFTQDNSTNVFRLNDMKLISNKDSSVIHQKKARTDVFVFTLDSFMKDIQGYIESQNDIYASIAYYTITDQDGMSINMFIVTDDGRIRMEHDVIYEIFPFNIGNIQSIIFSYTQHLITPRVREELEYFVVNDNNDNQNYKLDTIILFSIVLIIIVIYACLYMNEKQYMIKNYY
jgi:hypothetical protein